MLTRPLLRALGHQRYLRFGVRDRVLRRFDDPEHAQAGEFVVPFYGATYRGTFDVFIDWSVYYYGAYERDDLELIGDLLEVVPDTMFVDIGANVGHHTLFAATRCRKVIAIEPFGPLVSRIEQKLADNGLTNVILCPCGLGSADGSLPYFPPTTTNTGTGRFAAPGKNEFGPSDTAGALALPVRRGDALLRELGLERPGFIKIDTEGFERQVLLGLRDTLASSRPVVFVEWSAEEAVKDGDGRDLFPDQYEFYRRAPDRSIFGLLRQPARHLERLAASWPESDILAVPTEFRQRLTAARSARAASWFD